MKNKRRKNSLLAPLGLLCAAALPGCGQARPGAETETAAIKAAALEIAPESQSVAAVLGQGYDSHREIFKLQCVSSATPRRGIGAPSAELHLDRSVTRSQAERSLGFEVGAKARYTVFSGSMSARAAEAVREDEYSSVLIFNARYGQGNDSLNEADLQRTTVGQEAQRLGQWRESCGDEFVYQHENGGKLFILYRLDFSSKDAKSQFDAAAAFNYNAGVASAEMKLKIERLSREFKNRARVQVEAYQFGGDPTKLSEIFFGSSPTKEERDGAARAVLDCDIAHLDKCTDVLARALTYAPAFEQQLRDKPSPVKYITRPWTDLPGYSPAPAILTTQIKDLRTTLSGKFERIAANKMRIDRLLTRIFALPPAQTADLTAWGARLSGALDQVNAAVTACYDGITYDGVGQPLAVKVSACRAAVDAVVVEDPPAELLLAAGRYAIDYKWQLLGGDGGLVGPPRRTMLCVPRRGCTPGLEMPHVQTGPGNIGMSRDYDRGVILWSPATDAHEVHGDILSLYHRLGRADSLLGFPWTDEVDAFGGGRTNTFEGGVISWLPGIGAHEVHGDILLRWLAADREAGVGYPQTDESTTGDGRGRYNHFQRATIMWKTGLSRKTFTLKNGDTVSTEAKLLSGPIRDRYAALGWEGALGFPTTDIEPGPLGGSWADFERGSLTWHPFLGAYLMWHDVAQKYRDKNRAGGPLGYPVHDEWMTADGVGHYIEFQFGAIFYHPALGAHDVRGDVFAKWRALDWERGLGFPTEDQGEVSSSRGTAVELGTFERGRIYRSMLGTFAVRNLGSNQFFDAYQRAGGVNGGCLGAPTSDIWYRDPGPFATDYWQQNFEGGHLRRDDDSSDITATCY